MKKVILISIDGMRPDGLLQCKNPFVEEMMKKASYTLEAKTVFPSITLPCHLSLFHSVPPERHGTLNNNYSVPVRPVEGLFELIASARGNCAMFYNWDPMRQVANFSSLSHSAFLNAYCVESSDTVNTDRALECIEKFGCEFVYLYMVETDEKGGHDNGWMSEEYLKRISIAIDNVKRVYEKCGDKYTIIVTADHGGHDRGHGTDMDEDMTIPQFYIGENFEPGKVLTDVSILDTAPTIAAIMGLEKPREWEGKSLVNR